MKERKQGKIALKLIRGMVSKKGLPSAEKMREFIGLAKKVGIPGNDMSTFAEALMADFASQVIARQKKK